MLPRANLSRTLDGMTFQQLAEARQKTTEAIKTYAEKTRALELLRADRHAPGDDVADAAKAFRAAEQAVNLACQTEAAIIIKQLEAEESGNYSAREVRPPADSETHGWAQAEDNVPPDIDCVTLPDGSCVAENCRLHGPISAEDRIDAYYRSKFVDKGEGQ